MSLPICHLTNKVFSGVSNSSRETFSWCLIVLGVLASNTMKKASGVPLNCTFSQSEIRVEVEKNKIKKRGTAHISKMLGNRKDGRVWASLLSLLKSLGTTACAGGSIQLLDGDESVVSNNGDMHKFLIGSPGKHPSCITLRCWWTFPYSSKWKGHKTF